MKNKVLAILIAVAVMFTLASRTASAQDKAGNKMSDSTKTTVCMKIDTAGCAHKTDKACCEQAMVCPVSGKPANKEIFSEYKGQKVYFCCKDCKASFDKDPAKYEAKIHKCTVACKGATSKHKGDKACCKQAMVCPVSGQPGNKEIFSEYKGQKVYFCCNDCKAAFDKDPAKYEAKIHKCTVACKKECKDTCKKAEEPAKTPEPAQK
jgi:YHS domain-containing protein